MNRPLLTALAGVLLFGMASMASGPPPSLPPGARQPDQLDYVFFASDRPVLIRLHLRLGERPYEAGWNDWMDKMWAWFDKNNDGNLSAAEAARLPHSQSLQFMIQGSIGAGTQAVPFATLDTNKDGKISKDEFRAYYRGAGMGGLRFNFNNSGATNARRVNNAIYDRLGTSVGGMLTRDKLAQLPQLIRTLDENEDEMLTSAELNTEGVENTYGILPPVRRMASSPIPIDSGLLELKEGLVSSLASQLITRYDRNKDGKVTREEIGLSPEQFLPHDRNADGSLDALEVAAFLKGAPDLTFRIRVGALPTGGKVAGFFQSIGLARNPTPPAAMRVEQVSRKGDLTRIVKRSGSDNVGFELGDSRIQVQGIQGQVNRFNGVKQFYIQQFDNLAEKKGYVDRKQEKENQQQPFLFQIFSQADRDADGKLTKSELGGWLDLANEGGSCHVTLQVEDQGRGVFEVIDGNGDTRLSLREMRTAWDRVRPLCKDPRGLAQKDLPRVLRIVAGQGDVFFQPALAVSFTTQRPQVPTIFRGNNPVWFRKMDRNVDSDISPKEWLGTEEDFRLIDRDGDGLISGDEARQWDAGKKTAKQ